MEQELLTFKICIGTPFYSMIKYFYSLPLRALQSTYLFEPTSYYHTSRGVKPQLVHNRKPRTILPDLKVEHREKDHNYYTSSFSKIGLRNIITARTWRERLNIVCRSRRVIPWIVFYWLLYGNSLKLCYSLNNEIYGTYQQQYGQCLGEHKAAAGPTNPHYWLWSAQTYWQ